MRSKVFVYGVAFSTIIFVSGVAVGQRTGTSKFAKYLRPSVRTEMDWIALEANVDSIRSLVPRSEGIFIPQIYFNSKQDRPEAVVSISADFEKGSLDTIKSKITEMYYLAYYGLKNDVPELTEDDFVLTVNRLTADSDRRLYAECKHGIIVFH